MVLDAGELLVIRRVRQGRVYAVLPGGGVEPGETPREAALRELAEETGLRGRVSDHLATIDHQDRRAHYVRVVVERRPLALGGPERLTASAENRYLPAWVALGTLDELDLQPHEARDLVRGLAAPHLSGGGLCDPEDLHRRRRGQEGA